MKKKKKVLSVLFSISLLLATVGCTNNIMSVGSEIKESSNDAQTTTYEELTTFDGVVVDSPTIITEPLTKPYHDVDKYMYTTEKVNLREEDNTESEIIDKVNQYNKVKVNSTNDDWYSVVTDGDLEGFISAKYLKDLGETFVEVDISDQTLSLYVDDELDYTADVVTGKKGVHDTRLGCNPIYDKDNRGRLLRGADYPDGVYVKRWMPFDGGIGLHDASWRSSFGGDAYLNGSHGCVNMKFEDVDHVYKKVKVGTNVLVHK